MQGASDNGCNGFLLGVEHTIVLLNDDDDVLLITVDEVVDDEFRSDLLARTAVGLTGYIRKKTINKILQLTN